MAEPRPLAGVESAARYRLRVARQRFFGQVGGARGRTAGGSFDFLDSRDYVAGDDVRHVDWRGFARTGQLRVRQFEADVAPHVDVVVDTSPSMASTRAKATALRALVAAFAVWAGQDGASWRCHRLGGDRLSAPEAPDFPIGDGPTAPALPVQPLRRGGVRVLLTDGLWPDSPRALLHTMLAGAAHGVCVQLLDPWELAPTVGEALTLVDCETGERLERRLDAALCAGYRERLQRLCDELRTVVVGGGGLHAVVAAAPLATMCEELVAAGVLEPA